MTTHAMAPGNEGIVSRLNTRWHRAALLGFGAIVALHWVEHLVQAFQIWALGWAKPDARGFLGQPFPWLVTSEWLHYGFAVVMLVGLALLLPGFAGVSRTVWWIALGIQVWHLVEHQLLWYQYQTGDFWWDSKVPVSIIQHYFFPGARPELHLIYNALVTVPMLIAMWFHMYPPARERQDPAAAPACTCSRTQPLAAAA